MLIKIESIEHAIEMIEYIDDDPILAAVAERATEYRNLDRETIDVEEIEQICQTLCDISESGLMTGYNGFIYTNDLIDFYYEHQDEIATELNQYVDDTGCDFADVFSALSVNDIVSCNDTAKSEYVIAAIEYCCSKFCNACDR